MNKNFKRIPYNHINTLPLKKNKKGMSINTLVESIRELGLHDYLVVREVKKNKYEIVNGNKRLIAIYYIFENNMPVAKTIIEYVRKPKCLIIE